MAIFWINWCILKWTFKGFKGKFKDIWEGPKYDDPSDAAVYEITNNTIGIIAVMLVGTLLALAKC